MATASILTDILRLLTPEEISELTSTSVGTSRVGLTELLDMYADNEPLDFSDRFETDGAKILPFKKAEVVEVEHESFECGRVVQDYIAHFYAKIEMAKSDKSQRADGVVTSLFILKEKERFKYVQGKLKQKEVLDLYIKNSGVDIEQERMLKDDLSKSARSGVLVNKKQY